MRQTYGVAIGTMYGMVMVIVFLINAICYGAIYFKIRQVALRNTLAAATSGEKSGHKYHKAAKMMLLFVAVYLWQWWSFVVQALWGLAEAPHVAIYITGVLIINLGGVYNAVAYTVIRRKYASVGTANEGDTSTVTRTEPAAASF